MELKFPHADEMRRISVTNLDIEVQKHLKHVIEKINNAAKEGKTNIYYSGFYTKETYDYLSHSFKNNITRAMCIEIKQIAEKMGYNVASLTYDIGLEINWATKPPIKTSIKKRKKFLGLF